jgi:hypothetical protein
MWIMYMCIKCVLLHQYVSIFILCFIRFWMKLDKFIMAKIVSHLFNGDWLLQINEFNNQIIKLSTQKPKIKTC